MKIRTLIALSLLFGAVVLLAPGLRAGAPQDDESPVAEQMHVIKDGVKALGRNLADPEQAEACLEQVVLLQRAAMAAKAEVPPMIRELPEERREQFAMEFRAQMATFLLRVTELEVALLGDDPEAVQVAFGKVRAMKDLSHDKFTSD